MECILCQRLSLQRYKFNCVCVVPVKGSACGHTPGKASNTMLSEVWDGGEVGGHDGHRISWIYKEAIFSKDHVPVLPIATQHNSILSVIT